MSKKVLIAGGTGLIGKRLTQHFIDADYVVHILSRSQKPDTDRIIYHQWDPYQKRISEKLPYFDTVINLAGAGIADKRWTPKRKQEILDSRTASTSFLIDSLSTTGLYIGASAVGYYGDTEDRNITEEQLGDPDNFMSKVCIEWERSHALAKNQVERHVIFRIGIVLANEGGAFPKLTMPVKFGVGSYLGDGSMIYPWIHIDDVVAMIMYTIKNEKIEGIYNMVAPHPCTQKEIIDEVAANQKLGALKIPTPKFLLKMILGEMSDTIFMSSHVSSSKIRDTGFDFSYPTIKKAISALG